MARDAETPPTSDEPLQVPAQARPYVDALGTEMALQLFEHFGGTEIYIPSRPTPANEMVAVIGIENIKKLGSLGANQHVEVPLVRRWRALCYKQKGLNAAQIARKLGVTTRTVRDYLNNRHRKPPDYGQMNLFY